nr:HAD-like domain-containing protein [Tanacetum cinerariifolium]
MEFEGRRQKYDCLLFDLDDTLYPVSAGLAAAVLNNIKDYMVEKLGIDKETIPEECPEGHVTGHPWIFV